MEIRKYVLLVLGTSVALTIPGPCVSQPSKNLDADSGEIMRAVNKEICFDHFWNGGEYTFGSVISLHVARHYDHIDAWSDTLLHMRDRFITHFIIKANNGRIFVDSSESHNERFFPQMVAKLQTPGRIKLPVAADCTPTKAKNSAKARLIQKIAANELASLDAFAHRPKTKSIVIANVDDSYPESLVYVPATNELFAVRLTPGTSYIYDPEGPYLFGQILDKGNVDWVRPKILKYGLRVPMR